jgi:hypothetical protein
MFIKCCYAETVTVGRYIHCLDSRHIPRKMLHYRTGSKRPVGKPKRSWTEAVEEDCKKILDIRNWKKRSNGQTSMERLSAGGQGPMSGCCTTEEENKLPQGMTHFVWT